MELQQVGPEGFDARCKLLVAGIDGKRNLLRPAPHPFAERMGNLKAHMSRRGREKDEADQICARRERDIERLWRLQAADFDQDGH